MAIQLEGFEIGDSIGSGGFGEVWAARQLGVDRPVAIKVGHLALADAKDRLRFERECKALGRLSTHPNIATVHTSGTLSDGRPYLVLEYVDGGDLLTWASTNRATEDEILSIGLDLASGVAEAHRNEIVHRDLKPENLLLRSNGQAVLGDFGIAQMQDGLRTATGNITASVAYAAPEILSGNRATHAADIYGIGICLLVAATGQVPFTEPTDESLHPVLTRVLTNPPPRLIDRGISPALDDLVQRLMSKEPDQRPATAEAVHAELQALADARTGRHVRPAPQSTLARVPISDLATAGVASSATPPSAADAPSPVVPPPLPAGSAPTAPVDLERSPAERSSVPTPVLLGVAIVAVLALGGLVLFLSGRGDDPTETATTDEATAGDEATADGGETDDAALADRTADDGTPTTSSAEAATATSEAPVATTTPPPVFDPTEPIPIADDIEIPLDYRDYRIGLQEGQAVSVEVLSMGGTCVRNDAFDLEIDFLTESGDQIGSSGWPGNHGCGGYGGLPWSAPTSGTYTVRMRASDNALLAPTGSYDARIHTLRQRRIPVDLATPFVVEEAIDVPLDTIAYVADLDVGERVSIEISQINNGCSRADFWDFEVGVRAPDGELLERWETFDQTSRTTGWPGNNGCAGYGYWQAEVAGPHTLEIIGGESGTLAGPPTGTVQGVLGKASVRTSQIDVTGPAEVSGDIAVAWDREIYEFDAAAGTDLVVNVLSINGACDDRVDHRVFIIDPAGDLLVDDEDFPFTGCGPLGPFRLEATGPHQIVVSGNEGQLQFGNEQATGEFSLQIARLGG